MHLGQQSLGQMVLCGWPGIARLWLKGNWSSLVLAVGFSILLNLALVATFAWPQLLGESFAVFIWPVIFIVWIWSVCKSVRMYPVWSCPAPMAADVLDGAPDSEMSGENPSHTLFNQAQSEYLKGHWSEAETLLLRRLTFDERDIESRLLLATLYRHTRKLDQAETALTDMDRFDDSVHWKFEIERERELIKLIHDEWDDSNSLEELHSENPIDDSMTNKTGDDVVDDDEYFESSEPEVANNCSTSPALTTAASIEKSMNDDNATVIDNKNPNDSQRINDANNNNTRSDLPAA